MNTFSRFATFYFVALVIAIIAGFNAIYDEIKPAFRQASEETMVDTANLLAAVANQYMQQGDEGLHTFANIVETYQAHNPNAQIWSHHKQQARFDIYLTDTQGTVIYHSGDAGEVGQDYSRWHDVKRTLAGEYGARTTRKDPENELTSEMHVAAPVLDNGKLIGVLTVIQTYQNTLPFIGLAQTKLVGIGILLLSVLIGLGIFLALSYSRMLTRLQQYVESIRQQTPAQTPQFNDAGFTHLATTLQQMREELDGKAYIEQYVHTLTHELKTPLSAISAAAQILETTTDGDRERQFLANIDAEVERSKLLIEQLLMLSSLENQQHLPFELLDLSVLLKQEIETAQPLLESRQIHIALTGVDHPALVEGDKLLIGKAISNLLNNAIDFSNTGATIQIQLEKAENNLAITIINCGQPIPEYATSRLFDRFFSTPRPASGRKSSGLGLCIVKAIAELHGGSIQLTNTEYAQQNAVSATLRFSAVDA